MPIFDNAGKKSFHPNPQMGKALMGSPTAQPALGGEESPAEEAAEPTMITCPSCGDQFELQAVPNPEDEQNPEGDGGDDTTYDPNGASEV